MKVCGHSMYPLLRDGDILIVRHGQQVRRGDVAVYIRGGETVVHRVVRVGLGRVLTKGDNIPGFDPPVDTRQIVGIGVGVEGDRELRLDDRRGCIAGIGMAWYHSVCYEFWCGVPRGVVSRLGLEVPFWRGSRALGRMLGRTFLQGGCWGNRHGKKTQARGRETDGTGG